MRAQRQQGLALITAMLIVALVTTMAAYLALGQQVWLRQAQNLRDLAQIEALEQGILLGAAEALAEESKQTTTDNLTEQWAQQQVFQFGGGTIVGQAVDAQGRFNLNNLLRNGAPSAPDIGVLQRLLRLEGADANLSEAVIDWLDTDTIVRPMGAEDADYMSATPPYRAANRAFESADELRLVRGFTPELVDKLRPFIVALPAATSINVNTAPPEILSALFPNLPLSTAQTLASDLARNPLSDAQQLQTRVSGDAGSASASLDVKTTYFLLTLDTRFGRLQRRTQALLLRPAGGARATVLWRSLYTP
jgi:general secretion pathway protein K